MDREKQARLVRHYRTNFLDFAHDCLWIRDKAGNIRRFEVNDLQREVVDEFMEQLRFKDQARIIILKARQQGISTLIGAINYWKAIFNTGQKSKVLTHKDEATKELFQITQRFHERNMPEMKPKATRDNTNELQFKDLDSSILTGTAGSRMGGHGSTIQFLHWSEVSRSPNQDEIVKGVVQTVPIGHQSVIFLESTGNGIDAYFHPEWYKAVNKESQFEPIFFPWFRTPEYRASAEGVEFTKEDIAYMELYGLSREQGAWRKMKILEQVGNEHKQQAAFKEQYPATPDEAFQTDKTSFIDSDNLELAFKSSYEPVGAIFGACDPARKGKDKTAIAIRQGRKVLYLTTFRDTNTMSIANKCAKIIDEWQCDAFMVDVNGLGAGVYDRLEQLGYKNKIYEVQASASPEDTNSYKDLRSELWGRMDDWLKAGADLPEHPAVRASMTMLSYRRDSQKRLVLESKKGMSKSPDLADALAMTFFAQHVNVASRKNEEGQPSMPRSRNRRLISGRV